MDALLGFLARNDAECCKRELLGRSWRRDWGMCKFRPQNAFWVTGKNYGDWMLGGIGAAAVTPALVELARKGLFKWSGRAQSSITPALWRWGHFNDFP